MSDLSQLRDTIAAKFTVTYQTKSWKSNTEWRHRETDYGTSSYNGDAHWLL